MYGKYLKIIIAIISVLTLISIGYWRSPTGTSDVVRREFTTMGTHLSITAHPDSSQARQAITEAYREAERLNRKYSTHREDSLVSEIKNQAPEPVEVDEEFIFLLEKARDFWEATGGKFDITVGPLVELWGFYRQEESIPSPEEINDAKNQVGLDQVKLMDERVRLASEEMRLDFGAFVKGYAADRMAEVLREGGVENFLVNLGGNIYAGGESPDQKPWTIGLRDPRQSGEINGVIEISDAGVATSGDYERMFVHEGKRYAHIIDPITGRPVEGTAAVTTVASDALTADLFSTSLFLTGPSPYAENEKLKGYLFASVDNGELKFKVTEGLQNFLVSTRGSLENYELIDKTSF